MDSEHAQRWPIAGIPTESIEVSREAAQASGRKLNAFVSQAIDRAAVEFRRAMLATDIFPLIRAVADSGLTHITLEELGHLQDKRRELGLPLSAEQVWIIIERYRATEPPH